ncbi:MAG: fimbrillin family protein [Bacteroidaceae bacterium]|nr:fimbrillin family protein [Bacteroidaceae bacterium]
MPITIGSSVSVTRANITNLQNEGFGVWAFITNSVRTNYPYMENTLVEDRNGDGEWYYEDTKYWLYETQFSFIATYPYDDDDIYTTDSSTGDVQLTLSDTPSAQDYLMALSSIDTSDPNFDPSESVNLQFKHLLSNVSLNVWRDGVKHQNDQMRVRKVTLSNIRKAGTYSSTTDTWTTTNSKLTMEYTNDEVTDDDNIGAATQNNGSLNLGGIPSTPFSEVMLLPQTIDASSNSVSLKIEYELKRQNAADWESAELETILPAITWEKGKQYVYNVVLSSVTDITVYYIQTKVDPWGTPQVGGTVIIK